MYSYYYLGPANSSYNTYSLELDESEVRVLINGTLRATVNFHIDPPLFSLHANARAIGDTVSAHFSNFSVADEYHQIFVDDFNDGSIDPAWSLWRQTGMNIGESGGSLNMTATAVTEFWTTGGAASPLIPSLKGRVVFDDGTPLVNASVYSEDIVSYEQSLLAYTDGDGAFSVLMPWGTYSIWAECDYRDHSTQHTARNWHGMFPDTTVTVPGSPDQQIDIFFPQPVVTLPGWRDGRSCFTDQGTGEETNVVEFLRADWDHSTYGWEKYQNNLRSHIVFEMWNANEDSAFGYDNSGWSHHSTNGKTLGDLIQFDLAVNSHLFSSSAGVPCFNFLAHSMGGLYSRYYISKMQGKGGTPRIDRFVSLGSPHKGTIAGQLISPFFCLSLPYMVVFSNKYKAPRNTTWYMLAGTDGFNVLEGFPNDWAVGTWSVEYPRDKYPEAPISYYERFEDHWSLHEDRSTVIQAARWLDGPYARFQSSSPADCSSSSEESRCFFTALAINSQPSYEVIPLLVDDSSSAALSLQWSTGTVETTVLDPSGTPLPSPQTVEQTGFVSHIYDLGTSFPSGTYEIMLKGLSGLPTDGETVIISGYFGDGPVVETWPESPYYKIGNTVKLFAYSDDGYGAPFPGPSIEVIVTDSDGIPMAVQMFDDGLHDDGAANDALYGGEFATTIGGRHSMKAISNGIKPSSVAFERHAISSFDVALGTASFTGNFSDSGEDLDGDLLFDRLKLDVELNVDIGNFEVHGTLSDGVSTIAETGEQLEATSSGTYTVTLSFDGMELYRSKIDGPYFLSVVEVHDEDHGLILEDVLVNAHTTQTYLYTDFDAPPPPELVSVSPNWGPWNGGNEIVLSGYDLAEDNLSIKFNSTPVTDFEILGPGCAKVVVPNMFQMGGGSGGSVSNEAKPGGGLKVNSGQAGSSSPFNSLTVAITVETDWGSSTLESCYTVYKF